MIETERLRLRNWRDGDDALLDRHCNTPAVMRWLGGVQPREKVREIVDRLTSWQEERGHTFWAIDRKSDGAFLGFCGLKIADTPGSTVLGDVEAGWRLREDAWGQGYAKEAATASLDHAFGVLMAERVIALTVEGNEASWGLMERLGMQRRDDLEYEDVRWGPDLNPTIVYVIGRDQWRM